MSPAIEAYLTEKQKRERQERRREMSVSMTIMAVAVIVVMAGVVEVGKRAAVGSHPNPSIASLTR